MEANKQVVTLVCIGKSGAGKTTLINTLVNHIAGRGYYDQRVIAITQQIGLTNPKTKELVKWTYTCNLEEFLNRQSDRLGSGTLSQTTKTDIYEIELDDFTLKIIDTPGLADTAGIEQDEKNVELIINGIREVSKIDGILFVQKSTDVRLDIGLKYLISKIQGMLPKGCEDNFFTCLTAVVNRLKLDVLPALEEMGIPLNNYFTFENDALVHPSHLCEVVGISLDDIEASEEYTDIPEAFWKQNKNQVNKLIKVARAIKPLESRIVLDLSNKRKCQSTLVLEEAHRCEKLEKHKASIEAKKLRNMNLIQELRQNENFESTGLINVSKTRTVHKDIETVVEVTMDYYSTKCDKCQELCHEHCYISEVGIAGSVDLTGCSAFTGETCNTCTHKCSYNVHRHSRNRIVKKMVSTPFTENYNVQEKFNKVDHDMKKVYEETHKSIKQLDDEIRYDESEIDKYQDHIASCYRIMSYLQCMINNEAWRGTNEYYEEYIAMMIKIVNSDASTNEIEKAAKRSKIDDSLVAYRQLKKLAKSSNNFLTNSERQWVESRLNKIEQEEIEVLKMIRSHKQMPIQKEQTFTDKAMNLVSSCVNVFKSSKSKKGKQKGNMIHSVNNS